MIWLERLPPNEGAFSLEDVAADAAPVLARYLATTRTIHLLVAASDGTIRSANAAMAAALGVPETELSGRPVWGLLTEHDASVLRQRVEQADRSYVDAFILNFVDARQSPFTLQCHCDVLRRSGQPLRWIQSGVAWRVVVLRREVLSSRLQRHTRQPQLLRLPSRL